MTNLRYGFQNFQLEAIGKKSVNINGQKEESTLPHLGEKREINFGRMEFCQGL